MWANPKSKGTKTMQSITGRHGLPAGLSSSPVLELLQ